MVPPHKYRSIVVIAVVFLLVLALLGYASRSTSDAGLFRRAVLEMSAPMDHFIRAPLRALVSVWNRYVFLVGLGEENRRLEKRNAELAGHLAQYQEGYLESHRLQKLLKLKDEVDPPGLAARVIGIDHKSILKTILINRGSAHGLKTGLPVISDRGVVGRIVETSWHVSRVLLLTDGNSNIDAMIQSSRLQGIVQGAGGQVCTLKYIPKTEQVQPGDVIVTSGMTPLFPKGFILGTVIKADKNDSSLFQRVEVQPAVDVSRLEEVLVLLYEPERRK